MRPASVPSRAGNAPSLDKEAGIRFATEPDMTHDAGIRTIEPDLQTVATSLLDRLHRGDDLSAWALVASSSGGTFMVLLIHDGASQPRVLFGLHQPDRRSLPDRVTLENLDPDTVARAIATAYGRAIRRGDESVAGSLHILSTGCPTDASGADGGGRVPADGSGADEGDRVPTARIAIRSPSRRRS